MPYSNSFQAKTFNKSEKGILWSVNVMSFDIQVVHKAGYRQMSLASYLTKHEIDYVQHAFHYCY